MNVWQQDWVSRWALYSPDRIAICEEENNSSVTYLQLNEYANSIANILQKDYSITKGDRIAVLADFSIEYVALFSAAQKIGFIIVPINYRLSKVEVGDILHDADPKHLFVQSKYEELIHDKFITIKHPFIAIKALKSTKSDSYVQVNEDDPIFIIYTSGSTGKPKGVLYTHKMLFWNSINTSLSLKLNGESRTVNVMPPFHTGGWNVLLTPFLHHGGSTLLCNKFDAKRVLQSIADWKCTIFMGVPTMLAMMADEPLFQTVDISCLDYIIVGGESMPIPLIEKYATKGVAIRQGYGMTEVGPNLTSLHQEDALRKKGSIGRPNFYVQHRIVTEGGVDALANESGELWLRGPMVTPGYWNNQQASIESFTEDGKWFKTGDIVIEDTENYLYVVDRLKNIFISGAENVYPAEIEKVLIQIPEVQECAVIGVKDEKWGEVGKAFIVLAKDHTYSVDDIKSYCAQKLAKYKIPKHIVFVDSLPKTDSGKLDRKILKQV